MSETAVFDTSVLIDQIRTDRHRERILDLKFVIRNCSIVLAELQRGASSAVDRKVIDALAKNHPILTPSEKDWLESGRALAKIREDKGFEPAKLRGLHFDVLIALTVRSCGGRLITSNRADFELIREYREFKLEVW
jgi:predicted nucleic acid-binding protein